MNKTALQTNQVYFICWYSSYCTT